MALLSIWHAVANIARKVSLSHDIAEKVQCICGVTRGESRFNRLSKLDYLKCNIHER